MVKRLGLVLMLVVVLCGSVSAECFTNSDTLFWTDADRFLAIGKVIMVAGQNSKQAEAMMLNDMRDGVAIVLSKGTKVDVFSRPHKAVVIITLGGTPLCGLSEFVSCR